MRLIIKNILPTMVLLIGSLMLSAQTTKISGVVKDANTGETLIGANVLLKEGVGTVTDFDGKFIIEADNGEYDIVFSFVGYEQTKRKVTASGKPIVLTIELETQTLNEVNIVADMAKPRETPVAFTNVLPAKIENELAGRDLPMVLNSTPGVYATQQGGGDGDARINIRGFDQRNVAVMIDGIPVNDMENGWVYWSNWFGLDVSTRAIQVQRGLGRSKLAIPSVGGTLNILTKGIDQKAGGTVKQFVNSDGKFQTTVGYNSGMLKNGWGVNMALSYKQGDGYVDETWSKGWFYFFRIDKRAGNHLFTVTGMGAPQEHGQRSYTKSIATFNKEYAGSLSDDPNSEDYIDTTGLPDYGERYNPHWGYLERWKWNADGTDTIHASREKFNEKVNYYHKPQFSLKDLWSINTRLTLSNIFYVSLGKGGGTGMYESVGQDGNGQLDIQSVYNSNITKNPFRNPDGKRSGNIVRSSINNHYWYGFLSTLHFTFNEKWTFSGGIDLRSYKGEHYRIAYDMLGGEYYYDLKYGVSDHRTTNQRKEKNDKIGYWNDGLVRWGGLFWMAEYKTGPWSVFLNISAANTSYKRIDYFGKKMIELEDTTLRAGIKQVGDSFEKEQVEYNGKTYTMDSPEAKRPETDWESFLGYTFKGGVNYNIDPFNNVFFNTGYISKAPRFNNVYDNNNKLYRDIKNEKITAFELGYSLQTPKFAVNLNGYYTIWNNKPADNATSIQIDGESYKVNINGMAALHKGIELDFAYKPIASLDIQGLFSLGDWRWTSAETAYIKDDNGNTVDEISFDAKNVHVGDAAQTQFGASVKYSIFKDLYIKMQYTHFANYYADFDPLSLQGDDAGRDSWVIPPYSLVHLNAGYFVKWMNLGWKLNFNVKNLLDVDYISDATNNDQYLANNPKTFDAKSATVFMGLGRTYSVSLKVSF